MEIVKVLPDGTRLLSNGFKLLPSIGKLPDGTRKALNDMTSEEHKQWYERLQSVYNAGMNDFYRR